MIGSEGFNGKNRLAVISVIGSEGINGKNGLAVISMRGTLLMVRTD